MAIVFLVASLVVLVVFIKEHPQTPSISITPQEEVLFSHATVKEYKSEDSGNITVSYVGDMAKVQGGQYDGVVLRQAVADSGLRYEGQGGLSLWVQDTEVRIETAQQVAYFGTEVIIPGPEFVPEEISPSQPEADATSSPGIDISLLLGDRWYWQNGEVKLNSPQEFSLNFTDEDSISGTTDCNNFGGNYKIEDNSMIIENLITTLMACEGSEESVFASLLADNLLVDELTSTSLRFTNKAGQTFIFSR